MPVDYKKYHPDWKDKIRPEILKREGYRCKFCQVNHKAVGYRNEQKVFIPCDEFMINWALSQGIKTFRIILTIAHLDHDINNNDYKNLAALCQMCHLRYDKAFHLQNRKFKKLLVIDMTIKSIFMATKDYRLNELIQYSLTLQRELAQIKKIRIDVNAHPFQQFQAQRLASLQTKYRVKITLVEYKIKSLNIR